MSPQRAVRTGNFQMQRNSLSGSCRFYNCFVICKDQNIQNPSMDYGYFINCLTRPFCMIAYLTKNQIALKFKSTKAAHTQRRNEPLNAGHGAFYSLIKLHVWPPGETLKLTATSYLLNLCSASVGGSWVSADSFGKSGQGRVDLTNSGHFSQASLVLGKENSSLTASTALRS